MNPSHVHVPPSRWTSVRRGAVLAAALSVAAGAFVYAGRGAAQMPAAGAAAFEIRLHRAVTVGMRGRITADGDKHQTMRVLSNGQVARNTQEDTRVHLRAIERVLAVAPNGKAARSELTIERFETEDAQGMHPMLRPGQVVTVVRAPRGSDAQVTVGGRPVDAPVRAALDVVESFGLRGATDDEIFGTTQRQAVGATWPLHADVAQRDLASEAGMSATISGQSHVNAHTAFQGVDCLDVGAVMNATLTSMPNLPPGSVVRTGNMRATFRGMLPLNMSMQSLSNTTEISMEVVVDLPPDPTGVRSQIQVSMHGTTAKTFAPL